MMQIRTESNDQVPKRPAFKGAVYDRKGFCLEHPSLQIRRPVYIEGKIKRYEKIYRVCPNCASKKGQCNSNKVVPAEVTQTPPKQIEGTEDSHHVHSHSKLQDDLDSSLDGLEEHHTQMPLPHVSRNDAETPFDSKGRCHHHKDVHLASKRMGAWKVILDSCPKCVAEGGGTKGADRARSFGELTKTMMFENIAVHFDSNGCCISHPDVKVAKKKVLGRWKVVQVCPSCACTEDHISVSTKESRKSTRSVMSTLSNKSSHSSRSHGGRKARRDANITVVSVSGLAFAGETQWASIPTGHGKHHHKLG